MSVSPAAIGRQALPIVAAERGIKYVGAGSIPLDEFSPEPEPLSKEDIERYIGTYVQAAKNAAEKAGFDGIEVHNANGFCERSLNAVRSIGF